MFFRKPPNKNSITTDTIISTIYNSSAIKKNGADSSAIIAYNMQDSEYSPIIEYDCRKFKTNPRLQIVVNALFQLPESYHLQENAACLVLSIEANGVSYFYNCVDISKNSITPKGYKAMETSYYLPELKPNSVLKVYIWNVHNVPITLFDLNLVERIK